MILTKFTKMYTYITDHEFYKDYLCILKKEGLSVHYDLNVFDIEKFFSIFDFKKNQIIFDLKKTESTIFIENLLRNHYISSKFEQTYICQNISAKDIKHELIIHNNHPDPKLLISQLNHLRENNNFKLSASDIYQINSMFSKRERDIFWCLYDQINFSISSEDIYDKFFQKKPGEIHHVAVYICRIKKRLNQIQEKLTKIPMITSISRKGYMLTLLDNFITK